MSAPQPTSYPQPSAYASAVEWTRVFVVRVLWTALPFGSLGLLGWVQALRVARRRRTPKTWWWLAGLAGAAVVECVLLVVVPSNTKDDSGAAAGGFVVTYIITASVYNWLNSKDMRRVRVRVGPYPVAPTAWMPSPFDGTPVMPVMPVMVVPVAGAASTPVAGVAVPGQVAMPGQPVARAQESAAPESAAPVSQAQRQPQLKEQGRGESDMAAEVQAELRELRGLLGGGDAR